LSCRNELTCGRCGWLWNSDECSGGSHISGISHRVTNSARRVLSIGGVVVLCCCCVCHGGVYEGLLVLQTKKGGVRLTRVSFHHFFNSIFHNQESKQEDYNVQKITQLHKLYPMRSWFILSARHSSVGAQVGKFTPSTE